MTPRAPRIHHHTAGAPAPALGARSAVIASVALITLALVPSALAGSSSARPATRSERVAIMKSFATSDGNSAAVNGVYVSRSNASLAVVCERTPEAGVQAYVFGRTRGSWRYLTGGSAGRAGNSADRRLERACP
ncbi:MAG TPA: hypothetical protein VKG38_13495 [Solirubrobacteraceae bacterium]|nr:hypothetical protein [Solirubrobacteraceae bacterium]